MNCNRHIMIFCSGPNAVHFIGKQLKTVVALRSESHSRKTSLRTKFNFSDSVVYRLQRRDAYSEESVGVF